MKNDYERIEFGEVRVGEVAKKHLLEALETNWISMGPKTRKFEREWSKLFGYEQSCAVSSGTDAVINACLVLYDVMRAKRGDEIIVPALGFIATANAVRAAGFTPVFVDIKKETLNIDEGKIQEAITPRTKAIIAVHTMGRCCQMDVIKKIALKDNNLVLIEDCCEAHGAQFQDEYVGTFGDMACFSFYVAHLICCGEGGMVSTNSSHVANLLRSTRSHGRPFASNFFSHERVGLNSKMNDLEGSIGLEGIENFWETFNTRYKTMKRFREACKGFEGVAYFSEEDEGCVNTPHAFSITCKKAGDIIKVIEVLDKYNIEHKRNFGSISTQHLAFADMGHKLGDYPNAEHVGNEGVHVGVHQYLTEENRERMCKAFREGLELCR